MNWQLKYLISLIHTYRIAPVSTIFATGSLINRFSFSIRFSEMVGGEDEPRKVKVAVFSNIALCNLKLENFSETRKAVSDH